MNAKWAKQLRREAEMDTVGRPHVSYIWEDNGRTAKGTKRRGTVRVDPNSTRGMYLWYKKGGSPLRGHGAV